MVGVLKNGREKTADRITAATKLVPTTFPARKAQ
jgi:hypothetical protein